VVVGSGAGTTYLVVAKPAARTDLILHPVRYGRLELTIVERGALESSNNHDVVCRVKARAQGSQNATTIRWVIDEGTHVKTGDLLVELDDSALIDELKAQKITVDTAEADWIAAEEAYKIQLSQNESDIQGKQITLELAKIDLEKYQKGDYPQSLKQVEGAIKIAESDVEAQRDRAAWAQRMLKKGYYTVSQSDSEQSKLQSLELTLAQQLEAKRVLVDPSFGTKIRTETQLKNALQQAKDDLERTIAQARAKEVQARKARDTKKSIYDQGASKYKEIEDEIRKCKLTAPIDGLVVYYVPENTRFGVGRQAVVGQGESVAENQKLMQIPDLKHMFVNVKVHEAMISRVHKGQPATVRVESMANRVLRGHVDAVANAPSQQDFWAADVKVYTTKIAIDEEVEGLKPGMTAEVNIAIADAIDHALLLPIQAIVGSVELGATRKCFVMKNGVPEEREITVGMSNEKDAQILAGLVEGDQVVTNPKVLVGDKVRTRQPGEFATKEAGGDAAGPAGKTGRGRDRGAGRGPAGGAQGREGGAAEGRGKAGGQGGFQITDEMKKQFQEKMSSYQKATPEKRKEMLGNENEEARPFIKRALEGKGVKISD
jgi:HlyD family secretion protein